MTPRDEAECEVCRDLKKSTRHLLIDVYEEYLIPNRPALRNLIHA